MLKSALNRSVWRNRWILFNTVNGNMIPLTSDKFLPKLTSIQYKAPKDFIRSMTSITEMNQIRQNYHEESEKGVNEQINLELYASYVYLGMAYYFERDDVALRKVSNYFKKFYYEEQRHAQKLMKFQNLRGGRILLCDIKAPDKNKWENTAEAMEDALKLEKEVNQALLNLHEIASKHKDAQMADFLEREYLDQQVKDIKELGNHVTNLKQVGSGLGEYIFDKYLK